MFLSKSCEYALRSVLYLAARTGGELTPIRTISEALGAPYPFLAKVAQALIGAGILVSERGPSGGVALARPASDVTLEDIVIAMDGTGMFTECVLGLPGCGVRRPCPLHDSWAAVRDQLRHMFRRATLEEVVHRMAQDGLRLSDVVAVQAGEMPESAQ